MAVDLDDPALVHQRDTHFEAELDRLYRGKQSDLDPGLVAPVLPADPAERGAAVWNWVMGVTSGQPMGVERRSWLAVRVCLRGLTATSLTMNQQALHDFLYAADSVDV